MSLSIFSTILITILVLYALVLVCELVRMYIREIVVEEFEREKRCYDEKEKKKEKQKQKQNQNQNLFDKKSFEEFFKTLMEQRDLETTDL